MYCGLSKLMVIMDNRVAFAASDQITVDRYGAYESDGKRCRQAGPEEASFRSGIQRARNRENYYGIDDFHGGDRKRIGGQGQLSGLFEPHAMPKQRPHGQGVTEEKGQHDGQAGCGHVMPSQRRTDDRSQGLADGTARKTVQGGHDSHFGQ